MSLEIHNESRVTRVPWPVGELVLLFGSGALYRLALADDELYHRRQSAWHCPCPGGATIDHKRDLAAALQAHGAVAAALMLPTIIVRCRQDVRTFPAILKPINGYGGMGIIVADSPADLPGRFPPMVCSALVTECLLYRGTHKADLRMFAILHPGSKRVLLYKDALVRCCQTPESEGTLEALVTNVTQQRGRDVNGAPPLLSRFEEYVPDSAHRERVYEAVLGAVVATAPCVFAGKRIRARGFLMVGLDVLLSRDPHTPPTVLEYNVGWDRAEDSAACRKVQRGAVEMLVKGLVAGTVEPMVCVGRWG